MYSNRACNIKLKNVFSPKIKVTILKSLLWRCWADLNCRIRVLQTRALPLGYSTIYGAGSGN